MSRALPSSAALVALGLVIMSVSVALGAPYPQTPPRPAATPVPPQEPQPPPPPPSPRGQDRRREVPGRPVNIRVEVTLTQQSPDELEKTVTLVAADGQPGMLRTVVEFPRVPGAESAGLEQAPLGVDVMPRILDTGKIRVRLSVNYNVPRPGQGTEPAKGATQARAMLSETLTVLLDDGKPQLVSQSADALGSRSVGLTVKASVLK